GDSGVTLRITQEAPQMSSIINLVAAELGVSVVPASTAQLQRPGVRYLDIEGHMPLARLALAAAPGGLKTTPLVRHLWALAKLI
ncbi:LysR substrate-binding domain-containing protein, partial [Xanthomonas perforans]|nr:LysR substrate-binding domain-containing protein [Xanthomonas perforans]